ncbi:MAG: glycoside hydrolase family 57 protein [Myxococcota bacterium]
MTSVCLYLQIHQPWRLRRFGAFDIGKGHGYFDDEANRTILQRIAALSYEPTARTLTKLAREHEGAFRCALSMSGSAIRQITEYAPSALAAFQELVATGCVEILAETSHHSLSALFDHAELDAQIDLHRQLVEASFGVTPVVFRNTELLYSNALEARVAGRYAGMIVAEAPTSGRSPAHVYRGVGGTRLLPKSERLSDDIAFRFAEPNWPEYPLTAAKLAEWIVARGGDVCGLFLDYETFGEHLREETGIFQFLEAFPGAVLEAGADFAMPREVLERTEPKGVLDVFEWTSWADQGRDASAWIGNPLQDEACRVLYKLLRRTKIRDDDPALLEDLRRLTASDHVYYMATKAFGDGTVHDYFSPYESPYEAYIVFMNVLQDVQKRLGLPALTFQG